MKLAPPIQQNGCFQNETTRPKLPHPHHVLSPQSPAASCTAFHCVNSVSPFPALLQLPCFWKCPLSSSPSTTVSPMSPEACVKLHTPTPPHSATLHPSRGWLLLSYSLQLLSSYCLHLSHCSTNICFYLSLPLNPELVESRYYAFFLFA